MKIVDKFFLLLLLFVPVSLITDLLGGSPIYIFFFSAIGIIPLAKYIGESTEEIASRTTPAVGGLLNATFGNATELIIGLFALNAGLIEVVKASIIGSIIGNLLLALGFAIFVGGVKYKKQTFNRTAAKASASTLLTTVIALVIPALFLATTTPPASYVIERISVYVAFLMLIIYLANLFFSLYTHRHLYTEEMGKYEPRWSKQKSVTILLASTIFVAFLSEVLVRSITPVVEYLGWSELFIGVIIVALIGNVAEHASAVTVAIKNRMDLALQISIGSATQMAMLVAPLLIIVSLFFPTPMTLVFSAFELIAVILSILVVNSIVEDGESNWFEGLQLLIAYAIMAVAFFFHP